MKPTIAKSTKTAIKSEVTAKPEVAKKPEPTIRVVKAGVCPWLRRMRTRNYTTRPIWPAAPAGSYPQRHTNCTAMC